jgi:hypothetical protein
MGIAWLNLARLVAKLIKNNSTSGNISFDDICKEGSK